MHGDVRNIHVWIRSKNCSQSILQKRPSLFFLPLHFYPVPAIPQSLLIVNSDSLPRARARQAVTRDSAVLTPPLPPAPILDLHAHH